MLKINDINTFYGKNIHALKGVSLEVNKGEIVALVGNNGAGKTTLMNTIMGLLKPVSGSILYLDKPINGEFPHKIVKIGLSLSPEGREVFPNLTTEENLFLGSYTMKDKNKINDIAEKVYNLFPILKERASKRLFTVFTSNFDLSEIQNLYKFDKYDPIGKQVKSLIESMMDEKDSFIDLSGQAGLY